MELTDTELIDIGRYLQHVLDERIFDVYMGDKLRRQIDDKELVDEDVYRVSALLCKIVEEKHQRKICDCDSGMNCGLNAAARLRNRFSAQRDIDFWVFNQKISGNFINNEK